MALPKLPGSGLPVPERTPEPAPVVDLPDASEPELDEPISDEGLESLMAPGVLLDDAGDSGNPFLSEVDELEENFRELRRRKSILGSLTSAFRRDEERLPGLGEDEVSLTPQERARLKAEQLKLDGPERRSPMKSLLVILVVFAMLAGAFWAWRASLPPSEQDLQDAAAADYAAGGTSITQYLDCPSWSTDDDGVSKRLFCDYAAGQGGETPVSDDVAGKVLQVVVSQGRLDGAEFWRRSAYSVSKDMWVVTDGAFWGVMASDESAVAGLASAKGLPVCKLVKEKGLDCPVS